MSGTIMLEVFMEYTDGSLAKIGDEVLISAQHRGVVVADIDSNEFSVDYPSDQWCYLGSGVLIKTDFGGLVHYMQDSLVGETMELLQRA